MAEIPADWTESERWVWERIAAGEPADFNSRVSDGKNLNPSTDEGWGEDRRLSAKFFQTILTRTEFVDATPYSGVRIHGALIDDAPLNLKHARLRNQFWLEKSRILIDVMCINLRIDAWFSLEQSFVTGTVDLSATDIREGISIAGANFKKDVILIGAKVGGRLAMSGSTFKGAVNMDSLQVESSLFMSEKANFTGDVTLNSAKVGGHLSMIGSIFEGAVKMDSLQVASSLFMREKANFKKDVILIGAKVGGNLDMTSSTFAGAVDLTGCTVTEVFVLALSESSAARWKDGASLTLRNTHVGALQDWWRNETVNAWPKKYQIEGFTYDRLGWIGKETESDMLVRPVTSYTDWLGGDPGSSPQPYEHLARRFREAGEPDKSNDVLYAARERRRRKAWSRVDDYGQAKRREWLRAGGLWTLRVTIGYGLGNRYFRVLWWVGGLTLVGTLVLIFFGSHALAQWPRLLFASLDQLLPIITLDKAHDALIFGDPSAKPPMAPQPYGVLIYFYAHGIVGWALGSFLVAGLAGLTQRN